jgi:hypothetical protein
MPSANRRLSWPVTVLSVNAAQAHPLALGCIFQKKQVQTEGSSKEYVRDGQEGRKLRFHFCPDCGTTVFWRAEKRPDLIGVALGAFADPSFPEPTLSIWEEVQHSWVAFRHELGHFPSSP